MSNKPEIKDLLGLAEPATKLIEIVSGAIGTIYEPRKIKKLADAEAYRIQKLTTTAKETNFNGELEFLDGKIKISGDDILSVFFSKGIDPDAESHIFSEFEKEEDLNVMKITEGDETYGMILTYDDEASDNNIKNRCVKLFNKLKGNKKARIFHVTGLNGIEGAGDAYRLISESWSFVQSVFPYKRVFTKYELTLVSNCINIQIQGGFVKKNYIELLEPFKAAGENKGKQLLDTLETFVLDAGMNSGKTAEFMGIHTNTVQYRLKRINDVLGVEITGNRVIPGLTIALALKRLERVVS